ncbi:hypothetical protein [Thalassobius sp. Cn5-15]|uniref:hypothetical protein n=1 Tax=Thalassobius sp. Cn5-15 TaxID=2917763 RepID=UPI001EF3A4AE|nr:hypothetical protein [Thalassobius sp. Cn5-15]MCG7492488.1 hypothetical protein [Thalassobius sp. Cn5-15]
MNINWKTATKADRAALYLVARAIADAANTSVEAIMEQAFGHELVAGTDYLSNFRSGTIGRPKAKLIHAWIAEHHLSAANAVDPNLFPKPHTNAWDEHLNQNAISGRLKLVRFSQSSFGLVERARETTASDETIKLGEPFCLQLSCVDAGYSAAFQIYAGKWHSLPLVSDGSLTIQLEAGDQLLPIAADAKPDPIVERHDAGPHKFVVLIAPERDALPKRDEVPSASDNCEWHLLSVQVDAK